MATESSRASARRARHGPAGGGVRDQEESPAFIMNIPDQTPMRAAGATPAAVLGEVVG
ncbi:hypothetical protein [Streptacidiphilus neutrinimicus]|uniref:hypothetical protein n=1 Tax=Streptacidiphilus neutrinimicus TaxID=105420 RepID=UPI001378C4F3|nr:hypothetical protein [Streptacidiphilus neutrinimicus]